jgi:hypothetical protein
LRKIGPEARAIYAPFAKGYAPIAKLPDDFPEPPTSLVSSRVG